MKALAGLGIWIWQLHQCEGGDVSRILARVQACGVKWLAVKSGDSRSSGQITPALVTQTRAAGIELAAWWYSVPGTGELQVEQLKDLAERSGVQHFIQDAESEWETGGDRRPEAKLLAARIRDAIGPDAYFADAPWPIVRAHPGFPFREFGAIAQARMPQAYYAVAEIDGRESASRYLADGDLSWTNMGSAPVCPIVSPVNADGSKHAPLAELAAALDRYASRPALSIWSWQHLTAGEWGLLKQRAQAPVVPANDPPIFLAPPPPPVDPAPAI